MQCLSWILMTGFINVQKVSTSGCSLRTDVALNCCCRASLCGQGLSEIPWRSGVKCVWGCLFLTHGNASHSHAVTGCLWGPLWCGAPSVCPVIPLPIHFPQLLQNQHRVRGRLRLDADSGVLCRTPQEYQKAGNLHFNNSLIMYLSDLVNILHFLNFADCRCCGLSGR